MRHSQNLALINYEQDKKEDAIKEEGEGNIEEEDELDKFMKETKTEALNENRDIIINRIKRINA